MAFGGTPTNEAMGKHVRVTGGTLTASVGAFDPGAGDCARLVTAAPGTGEHGLPDTFGPGRGNWTDAHVRRIEVECLDIRPDNTYTQIDVHDKRLEAGDLVIELINRYDAPTNLIVRLHYTYLEPAA